MTVVTSLFIFPGASVLASVRQKLGGVLLLRVEGGDGTDGMLHTIFFRKKFQSSFCSSRKYRAVKAILLLLHSAIFLSKKKNLN